MRIKRDKIDPQFIEDEELYYTPQVITPQKIDISLHLSPREIAMVRKSWAFIVNGCNQETSKEFNTLSFESSLFCQQLYNNMFELKPEISELFPNIKHQLVSFASILNITMNNLEDLSVLENILEHLGRTHSRILGIEKPFFELMGDSFIITLQNTYMNSVYDFDLKLENSWIKVYSFLLNSILQYGIDPVLRVKELASRKANLSRQPSIRTLTPVSSYSMITSNSSVKSLFSHDTDHTLSSKLGSKLVHKREGKGNECNIM